MTINAIAYESVIEAQINATSAGEFAADFAQIKRIPERDRAFNSDKKVWVIRNPEEHKDVPFVQKALENASYYVMFWERSIPGES